MIKPYRKLYLDFDGVIAATIESIVECYNEDYKYYKKFEPVKWWEVNSWNFDECTCADKDYINTYFNQPRFFEKLKFMPSAKEVIMTLAEFYDVKIVSMGYRPNLTGKQIWIDENLPGIELVPVNMRKYVDKAHVDMSDAIFVDDSSQNLVTSNAALKILFGDIYEWNADWGGKRCLNWTDVRDYLL